MPSQRSIIGKIGPVLSTAVGVACRIRCLPGRLQLFKRNTAGGAARMAWKEAWPLKIRRRLRKPFNKLFHRGRYFISRYRGADFLLRPDGIGTLEMSAKIAEYPELTEFMRRCADLRPDAFIDIGANIGLYSCILLRNGSVPRAILFEPDRHNLIHLRANLMINGLLDRAEVHEVALGDAAGAHDFVPGTIDGGFSRIADGAAAGGGAYQVPVVRLDDVLSLSGQTLAIKTDVEHYECHVLAGMTRTLGENRCLVQVEAFETRDQVISIMAGAGYGLVADFTPNYVFEPAGGLR
jgi:FkbM family methyltransferase